MKAISKLVFVGLICFGTVPASLENAQPTQSIYEKIEMLTGTKGKFDKKEGVFKVSFPRSDLKVDAIGTRITPSMGLTVWAAFKVVGDHAMMMGDMVLLEEQVNPVMSIALENGLQVTALHNHFFWESPRIMFMHIGGSGDPEKLASAVGKVFAKIKEANGEGKDVPKVNIDPAKTSLDPPKISAILGYEGQLKDGVYKVTIGRTTSMDGHEMGGAMGVNTWAAFAGSDDQAIVDGDFATLESELQPVLKALRAAGINVVAIHNHMVGESPRIVFLHYWGMGSTTDLAKGLKIALDTQEISFAAGKASPITWDFERDRADNPPVGFSFGRTGEGRPGRWVVASDKGAFSGVHVLTQTDPDPTDYRFPVAVADAPILKDLRLSVRCKPVSGQVDQAAGLVFRYQDENNYYVTRANALEGNVRLYKVVNGQRQQFADWNGPVTAGVWHEYRVEAKADHLEVFWDGQKVISADDKTFQKAGLVGVWTKADSMTCFDDMSVESLES